MSSKEQIIQIVDSLPEYKVAALLNFLQVFTDAADIAKQISERERAAALLGEIPQSKLGYAIGYFQGLLAADADKKESEV